ncbi:MAG TPA: DUF5703 domain-containing protein [Phnomibacter sp.]|nr:DUF5703 domain-containing protein [Phnomibacter sp.]
MKKSIWLIALLLIAQQTLAQTALQAYDIVWPTPSRNAAESMPCGGGDVGLNVWVEQGDVMIYAARSGHLDEHNTLLKAGRLRIRLTPNPFTGSNFKQQLHLNQGYISIQGNNGEVQASLRIWANVYQPVAQVEVSSNKKVSVTAAYESWRYKDRVVPSRENYANSWKWGAPKANVYKADSIAFENNGILFYHHNGAHTIFDTMVVQQGLQPVKEQLYNPLKHLAFGGLLWGKDFVPAHTDTGIYVNTPYKAWWLKTKAPASRHTLQLALHSQQTPHIGKWREGLLTLQQKAIPGKEAQASTIAWWQQFWQRSFIHIAQPTAKDTLAWQVGRNYQLFRYMLACNAHGYWPTKFNGGLFTVAPAYTDGNPLSPDYRNWGGGLHTAQNQRLVYFPMIKAGDFDLLQPQLQFYLRLQQNAQLRSKQYWGHDSAACFTEQMENFGLPNFAEYGLKRPAYFDKGVEYNAWLEYQWDTVLEFCLMMLQEYEYTGTDISQRIPFILSCLKFFDKHYQYLARQRGTKALDENGKLILYPGSAAETYKMAYNANSTIAALYTICSRLLAYFDDCIKHSGDLMDQALQQHQDLVLQAGYVNALLQRIPYLSFTTLNGHTMLAPAIHWERINNIESPQLYPVYPWGLFGLGLPGLDTALNTWYHDTTVIKNRSHIGWKQDNIWAARLGLAQEAWRLTALKLKNSERRFPAFWGPGFDWVPDHNWGGSGMIGLQEMLLQTVNDRLLVFAAWPREMDVHFKLHAPGNTTIEAQLQNGIITKLVVQPQARMAQVEVPNWK